jgi:hypothetical protein
MKTTTQIAGSVVILVFAMTGTSCMTTYDAAGRPVQSVDPGAAAAGAIAAGALGYAIGQNNDNHNHYYYGGYRRPYYNPYGYRRGGYGHRGHWHR